MKIKLLLPLLLLTSQFFYVSPQEKKPIIRRQRITNNTPFPIKVGLTQEGKLCKKRKEWTIKSGKKLKIFMVESCHPVALELWIPGQPKMKFTVNGRIGTAPLVFSTQTPLDTPEKMQQKAKEKRSDSHLPADQYVYWNIDIEGKEPPLEVTSSNYTYSPRRIRRVRGVKRAAIIVGAVLAVPIDIALGIVTLGVYNMITFSTTGDGMYITRLVGESFYF
jgi:hypothetical protein